MSKWLITEMGEEPSAYESSEGILKTHTYLGNWRKHVRGKERIKLEDDGNGVTITIGDQQDGWNKSIKKKKIRLDYSGFVELLYAMSIHYKENNYGSAELIPVQKSTKLHSKTGKED